MIWEIEQATLFELSNFFLKESSSSKNKDVGKKGKESKKRVKILKLVQKKNIKKVKKRENRDGREKGCGKSAHKIRRGCVLERKG